MGGSGCAPSSARQSTASRLRAAPGGSGQTVDAPLLRAAEVFQHAEPAGAEAALAQQRGDLRRAGGVVAQHQEARAGVEVAVERGQRAGDQRHAGAVLQRPAEPRGGQRQRGGRRQYAQLGARQLAGQAGADAVEHRVAAGQHAGRRAAPGQHRGEAERAGPGLARAGHAARQQGELALGADDVRGAEQGAARRLAQAGETVLADAYDGQPGRHAISSWWMPGWRVAQPGREKAGIIARSPVPVQGRRGNTDRRGCPRNCPQRVRHTGHWATGKAWRTPSCQPGDLPAKPVARADIGRGVPMLPTRPPCADGAGSPRDATG